VKIEKVEPIKTKSSSIPEVMDKIFYICKTEENFPLRNQIEKVDLELERLEGRVQKQNQLLQKSQEIKSELEKRMNMLDGVIFDLRSNLLESLGSEI